MNAQAINPPISQKVINNEPVIVIISSFNQKRPVAKKLLPV
jgi:hypothetical protein